MRTGGVLLIAALAGCTGQIRAADDVDDGPAAVAFTAPVAGSTHVREVLAADGWLVAGVAVAVDASGADAIEIAIGDRVLGAVDAAGALDAEVRELGPVTLTARALAGGAVVAEDTVEITIGEPTVADCRGWLDLYQLAWTDGPDSPGVADPIELAVPVNGVSYRYISNDAPRAQFNVVDCELALSLARAAPMLRARGVVEVADYGVYNYRCIGGGTPPDCPNGISQHAYAKAIDIAGLTDEVGTFYSVNDDWVIDPDGEDTCLAPTEPGADAFLHQTICELKAAGVWNIVLTPNYNAAHRDHFHVDLTPGSDFIEHGPLVDTGPDAH